MSTGITFINPRGGLGNQMFQIAAAFAHAAENNNKLLICREKASDEKRPRYWNSALKNCEPFLCDALDDDVHEWVQPENGVTTYSTIPSGSWRLNGLFQSSRFFSYNRDAIRALFRPSPEIQTMIKYKYADLLARKNVVVVHARRGDYLGLSHVMTVLPESYYTYAMDRMRAAVPNPHFLLICEEPEFWDGAMLGGDSFTVLDEKDDVLTMFLMTHFKHFIIANSTFSWWGAWLADASVVFAPRNWFGPYGPQHHEDIYEPSWIVI